MQRTAVVLLSGTLFAQAQPRLTDQRIVDLVSMGVSEQEVVRIIETSPKFDFDLRPPSTDAMLQAGVSEEIVKAMAAREAGATVKSSLPGSANLPSNQLPLPAASPKAATDSDVSARVSSSARYDQPPKPIFAPLPELPPDPKPVVISVRPLQNVQDPYTLSDSQVNQIIRDSLLSDRAIGVPLREAQNAISGGAPCRDACAPVTVYTRENWIELAARNAKRAMQPFSAADVSPAMRMLLLFVTVPGGTSRPAMSGVGPGLRFVLKDTSGHSTIQPIELPDGAIESSRAFRLASSGMDVAAFQVSDVNALRALDRKGEFFVMVAGSEQNKYFKVKAEHFRALFGSDNLQSLTMSPSVTAAP